MRDKTLAPPYGNTGVLSTIESGLRACVDWAQGTLKNHTVDTVISDVLKLDLSNFVEQDNGKYGYKKMRRFGHIKVYYDGSSDMGVHFEMGGQACREYEEYQVCTWAQLFAVVLAEGHFTRVDIAIDDFNGYFKIATLESKIKKGELISKFKRARHLESIEIKDGASTGKTIYLGATSSAIQIRFYDKKSERENKGKEVVVDFWNRSEIQARDAHANAIARMVVLNGSNVTENGGDDNCEQTIGMLVKGILAEYLRFVQKPSKGGDTNKSRWKTARFWTKFLGDVEKLSLTNVAPDKTIEKSVEWLERQVAPTLALIYKAYDSDSSKILEIMNNGVDRLGAKEEAMLQRFRIENKEFVEGLEKKHKDIAEQKEKIRRRNEERQKNKSNSALTPYDFM